MGQAPQVHRCRDGHLLPLLWVCRHQGMLGNLAVGRAMGLDTRLTTACQGKVSRDHLYRGIRWEQAVTSMQLCDAGVGLSNGTLWVPTVATIVL